MKGVIIIYIIQTFRKRFGAKPQSVSETSEVFSDFQKKVWSQTAERFGNLLPFFVAWCNPLMVFKGGRCAQYHLKASHQRLIYIDFQTFSIAYDAFGHADGMHHIYDLYYIDVQKQVWSQTAERFGNLLPFFVAWCNPLMVFKGGRCAQYHLKASHQRLIYIDFQTFSIAYDAFGHADGMHHIYDLYYIDVQKQVWSQTAERFGNLLPFFVAWCNPLMVFKGGRCAQYHLKASHQRLIYIDFQTFSIAYDAFGHADGMHHIYDLYYIDVQKQVWSQTAERFGNLLPFFVAWCNPLMVFKGGRCAQYHLKASHQRLIYIDSL